MDCFHVPPDFARTTVTYFGLFRGWRCLFVRSLYCGYQTARQTLGAINYFFAARAVCIHSDHVGGRAPNYVFAIRLHGVWRYTRAVS